MLKSSGSIVSFSRDVLGQLVTVSVDLILTFVLSVYMLAYAREIGNLVRRWMPAGDGTPADDYPTLIQHAVSSYVRGQLLFSLIMGGSCALLMELMGLLGIFHAGSHYAVFFGLFYGLMELIPYIGPIIGPIPPMVVALATQPIAALWLLIAIVLMQQLEGHLVAPQVFRISLRINPILVILDAAGRLPALRDTRCAARAADCDDDPRHRALPAQAPRARTVDHGSPAALIAQALGLTHSHAARARPSVATAHRIT